MSNLLLLVLAVVLLFIFFLTRVNEILICCSCAFRRKDRLTSEFIKAHLHFSSFSNIGRAKNIDFVREDRLMTDAQFLRYLLIVHSRSDRIDNIKL
jgi:hypothetical protein